MVFFDNDQPIACTSPFFCALAINVCRIDHTSQIIDKSCSFLWRNVIHNENCIEIMVKFTQSCFSASSFRLNTVANFRSLWFLWYTLILSYSLLKFWNLSAISSLITCTNIIVFYYVSLCCCCTYKLFCNYYLFT